MFKTPLKDPASGAEIDNCCSNSSVHELCGTMQALELVCSVCQSPCIKKNMSSVCASSGELSFSDSHMITPAKPSVETKCNHYFHTDCLNQAKAMKPECPLCRCPLTPLGDEYAERYPNIVRQAVISAGRRARNAVRDGILRREMAQRQQQEISVN